MGVGILSGNRLFHWKPSGCGKDLPRGFRQAQGACPMWLPGQPKERESEHGSRRDKALLFVHELNTHTTGVMAIITVKLNDHILQYVTETTEIIRPASLNTLRAY